MRLEETRIPPVSQEFYERLLLAFPPIDPRNITASTPMMEIQRNAAQQEMIYFIKAAVREHGDMQQPEPIVIPQTVTIWGRIKSLLFKYRR